MTKKRTAKTTKHLITTWVDVQDSNVTTDSTTVTKLSFIGTDETGKMVGGYDIADIVWNPRLKDTVVDELRDIIVKVVNAYITYTGSTPDTAAKEMPRKKPVKKATTKKASAKKRKRVLFTKMNPSY